MVRSRSAPATTYRERRGDLAVPSRCAGSYCVDGLRDLRSGRDLIAPTLTADEAEGVAAPGTVERVVRVAFADATRASAYLGATVFTRGAAHSNNTLRCETLDRASGRALRLGAIVGAEEAAAVERVARDAYEAAGEVDGRYAGFTLDPRHFLYDSGTRRVTSCLDAPFHRGGTVVEITVAPRL